jgi:alkaline phosphatase
MKYLMRVTVRIPRLGPIVLAAVIFLTLSRPVTAGEGPRNIILLIGDGMGVAHLTLGHLATGGMNAERMPVGGLIKTFPFGGMVTDSAASGTAMATGRKTRNGMISISPEGDTLRTVLECAEERGMATGLVATSQITHATPAVFAAHVIDRGMEAEIARQMAGSGVDVLIGGGWSYFLPGGTAGSRRKDEIDLVGLLRERMPVVNSVEGLLGLEGVSSAAAFLAPLDCPPAKERSWSLAELTSSAIEILSQEEKGFFLMVEGSQIDWAAHDGDDEGIFHEMKDFDGAVGIAMDFAEGDGATLVIMTSDHETGGFALHEAPSYSSRVVDPAFTTDHHTMEMVPILAYGPGAEEFGGIHDNTFIGIKLIEYLKR